MTMEILVMVLTVHILHGGNGNDPCNRITCYTLLAIQTILMTE